MIYPYQKHTRVIRYHNSIIINIARKVYRVVFHGISMVKMIKNKY